jgi:hypothetical protein
MKNSKKMNPPGTFIPTPQRLMAIIQLCLAFSFICWYSIQPFMGEYFSLKSRSLLYEYVMGTSDTLNANPDTQLKSERQKNRFKNLSSHTKEWIIDDYKKIQKYLSRSIQTKLQDGIKTLFFNIPPFELAWLFFSVVVSILILLKKEGSKAAAYLLPLIVFAYAIDNQLNAPIRAHSPDDFLFPSEETIINNYLSHPINHLSPLTQKKELQKGWENYLINHWLPINFNHISRDQRIEQSEFLFTIARLKTFQQQNFVDWLNRFNQKEKPIVLVCYILWNMLFAAIMNRSNMKRSRLQQLNLARE